MVTGVMAMAKIAAGVVAVAEGEEVENGEVRDAHPDTYMTTEMIHQARVNKSLVARLLLRRFGCYVARVRGGGLKKCNDVDCM